MDTRTKVLALVLITMVVFGWSTAMVMTGHEALIATLSPVLGLTVQQVVRATRSRNATTSGNRVTAVADKEDGAP
ncbi:hypothetical protein [Streptomyces olivaceoviridis]|uniref:hypothetical protein n=1 Tax=Streptomyces olivaceoviridis TaxID=1921 RepID=UPI0037A128FB